jgi:choline dehydrogenase-like flavoprotein
MFDYVIVGAGSAGCVLAARLSEDASVNVALLEAGPADQSALIHCPAGIAALGKTGKFSWGLETVPQPGLNGRRGYQPRGKVLGGSSSINAMIYVRGQPEDYDGWAAAGNLGWAWADVLPYFKKSEHNERGANGLHGTGGPLNVMDLQEPNQFSRDFVKAAQQAGHAHNPDFNGAQQEGVGLYQVTHKAGERFSAAKGYLAPVRHRPNLQVLTDTQALRVVFEGRRATGVEVLQAGQKRLLTARREVLLSAGAFQSPQLLKLSGVGPGAELQRHAIALVHELPGVGEHLHDHPDAILGQHVAGATELFGLSLAAVPRMLKGVWQWRQQRRGILTTNFAEAGGFVRSSPAETRPDLQLHFVIAELVDHGRKTRLGHGLSCHVCVLRPKSRGRVSLASNDPLATPLIDPNFLADGEDVQRLVTGVRMVRHILSQPALARHGGQELSFSVKAKTDTELEAFVRQHADTVYHPVGSCRMGPGAMDVVDAQLRVHGVQSLRVVDASVMPEVVSGNTNAPTIMIAEKAADMIRAAA